jgi:5-methyltetrahydrofolate--homocysteine methyltransferase
MMGITPGDFAKFVQTLEPKPVAYGANCGVGASDLTATIALMAQAAQPGDIIVAKGNCGIPFYEEGKIKYNGTPELMADYAQLVRDAGARIVGGCCGTSPEHLKSIRASLDGHIPGPVPTTETIVAKLGPLTSGAEAGLSGHAQPDAEGGRRNRRRRSEGSEASF